MSARLGQYHSPLCPGTQGSDQKWALGERLNEFLKLIFVNVATTKDELLSLVSGRVSGGPSAAQNLYHVAPWRDDFIGELITEVRQGLTAQEGEALGINS